MTPAVSAIVVSYHTGPRLKECLYALVADPAVTQIVIVDNGNPPETAAFLDDVQSRYQKITLVRDGTNPGFGAAVNKGVQQASSKYILVINPDAVLRRGSVEALIQAGQDVSAPWIVGGRIFGIDGKEQRGGRRKTLTLWRAIGLQSWNQHREPLMREPVSVGAISGAFFLMKKTDFNAVGGFDETYFLHFEDVDLCRRVMDAGGAVIFQPSAGALHYTSTSDVPSDVVLAHKADSLKYYLKTHARGPFEKLLTAFVVPLIGPLIKRRG